MHDDLPPDALDSPGTHAPQDAPVNDEDPAQDEIRRAMMERLADLRQQHQDLDAAIQALELTPMVDQLQVARLKKQKLGLRDMIVRIEDQLTPDIIA